MSSTTYPVRVDAHLDEHLSRWLWLVKWFLAIPHFLVLALLWLAFVVLSVVAFFAILVTGRYPRSIFDFNVGVLRWSWRVSYYTYGGLGTDHYPPFSLDERPDFPAHLEIAYPEHLSRGLVLVKWWLLAIPHYVVLGLFLGGGAYAASDDVSQGWNGGLIGLLVLIAGVLLLFTGRYPRSIFDLVLGLNRWVLRVAAYAGLMTDAYPPFRLDMGGDDPGTGVLALDAPPAPAAPAPAAPSTGTAVTLPPGHVPAVPPAQQPFAGQPPTQGPPPTARHDIGPPAQRWGAGRVLAVVLGSLMALTALGLLAGGAALRIGDSVLRDDNGYLMSDSSTFESPGLAVTSRTIHLDDGSVDLDLASRWLGTVRVLATSQGTSDVFVGIAPTTAADDWFRGVAHSTVLDASGTGGDPETAYVDGPTPVRPPGDESFWVASATGPGPQALTWEPVDGDWTVVVMNADGTAPVRSRVAVGAEVPVLDDVADGLLITGALLLPLSGLVLWLAVRRRGPAPQASA
ncbi:DUF4389 domain-containing protein [Nocardioides sp. Soil805]|uniref:DUF4389 domain-containing protein n=1 Tax=Nocardioides sp. Soil805 TaxID=1736416 RepID=UPI000703107A|nr:DUF4389 domain-containing protein [Nocardioides sp. Soil805]KRF30313.1 hypothetical protein ASG94_20110 [Nocardioides sp. Soil805]